MVLSMTTTLLLKTMVMLLLNDRGEYTRMKGLERDKYLSMIYEFIKNGSPEGVMLYQIFDFLNEALPKNKDEKSQKRFLGYLVNILKTQNRIVNEGKRWVITK